MQAVAYPSCRVHQALPPTPATARRGRRIGRRIASSHALTAWHGGERLLPDLLHDLAKPGCPRIRNPWDRCGAHYVDPMGRDLG